MANTIAATPTTQAITIPAISPAVNFFGMEVFTLPYVTQITAGKLTRVQGFAISFPKGTLGVVRAHKRRGSMTRPKM